MINIITGLSVFGLGIGAAAVIIVLSVFNGFGGVIQSMFSKFNPEVRVIPIKGKTFDATEELKLKLGDIDAIEEYSFVLEEKAFFEYDNSRAFGQIKGVDDQFTRVSNLDSALISGNFWDPQKPSARSFAVVGSGLHQKLGLRRRDEFSPIKVFMAKRKQKSAFDKPFNMKPVYLSGVFNIQQEYDQEYLLTNINLVRELLNYDIEASSIEIKLKPNFKQIDVAEDIQLALGQDFDVLDRNEQDADLQRLMNIEKWLSYVILSLVLLLVSFNLIGGLWLIVSEKKTDIAILKSLGATNSQVKGIMLCVGLLLSCFGAILGVIVAVIVYYLQINFDLISVPEGLVVSAYPISMEIFDVIVVALTVIFIGFLASIPAANKAVSISEQSLR